MSGGGLKPGSVLRGKWTLEGELGAGGMATVYAGTHRNGMRGAIKVLHPRYAKEEQTRSRMLREGYLANKIKHRGIVRVLDDDVTEEGWVFLVMELLEGETLKDRWVNAGGKLPLDEALDIADEVLDVLVAAHAEGVIHRDIKPDNIFILENGDIKLLDFGIARVKETSGEMTQTGAMLGTPAFMSPEQALAHWDKVDGRSDVFAVGATVWTMLTGELTHKATTVPELLVAAATKQAKPIHTLRPDLPAPIAAWIDRALAFEKEARWPSAETMLEALREARKSPGATVRMDLGPDPAAMLKKLHGPKTVEAGPMVIAPTLDARASTPPTLSDEPTSARTIEMPAVSDRDPSYAIRLPAIAFDATPVRLQQAIPFEPTLAVASSSQSVPLQGTARPSVSFGPVILGAVGTVALASVIFLLVWRPWEPTSTPTVLPTDNAQETEAAPIGTPRSTDTQVTPTVGGPAVTAVPSAKPTAAATAQVSAAPSNTPKTIQRPSQPLSTQKPQANDWMNKPSQPPR